jgi:hypothetical protein
VSGYIANYHAAGAHLPESGERAILRFFDSLNLADWQDFLTDIGKRSFDAFDVIRPPSSDFLIARARSLFSRLSPLARDLAARALGRLLGRFARGLERDDSAVIDLLLIAVSFEETAEALKSLVTDPDVSRLVRVEAARVIANFSEPESFWFYLNYQEIPELAPSMVAALRTRAPLRGLQILVSMPEQPCPTERLEYPVKSAIEQLLGSPTGKIALVRLLNNLPSWATLLFARSLELAGKTPAVMQHEGELSNWEFTRSALDCRERIGAGGQVDGATLSDLKEGVGELLERWSPFLAPGDVPLEVRIELFEAFPSPMALAALVAIGLFFTAKLRGQSVHREDESAARRILRAIAMYPAAASTTLDTKRGGFTRSLTMIYRDLLRSAIEIRATAAEALRVLVNRMAPSHRLGEFLARAAVAKSLTIAECQAIIAHERNARVLDAAFRAMGDFMKKGVDSVLGVTIGAQVYDLSPELFAKYSRAYSRAERLEMGLHSKAIRQRRRGDPGELRLGSGARMGVTKG